MALNDTSMHPHGALAGYPGVANPSTASTDQESDAYATNATLSGHVPPAGAPKPDSVEGKPGIIETAEIAPLGEGKVVDDPGLLDKATTFAKDAAEAITGTTKKQE